MEGQLRKLRNNTHPKTGAWLPDPIELDIVAKPSRIYKDDPDKVKPEGFYVYVPAILPPAIASDSTSGAERWKQLVARINGKEQLSTSVAERGGEAGRGDSQLLIPLAGTDSSGGVWGCLFPG